MQRTLAQKVVIHGHGLHSACPATLTMHPAQDCTRVQFCRTDIAASQPFSAHWSLVEQSPLATKLVGPQGQVISTIEHLMAAIAGLGIDNVLIEIDGPEVPILDGSSAGFVRAIQAVGVVEQEAPRQLWKVIRPVEVRRGDAVARLEPSDAPEMRFEITFADAAIGHQEKSLRLANGTFLRELSDSRTFCRRADVEAMQEMGLARGGSLDNAVVVEGDTVLNPGGLRHEDEAVRHKMLDAVGDLALAGHPILGRYVGVKAGHSLTNELLRVAFAQPGAMVLVNETPNLERVLPGASLPLSGLRQAI